MLFSQAVQTYTNKPRTTNGMATNADTKSAVLDLFGKIGSSRNKDITHDFIRALRENEDLAIRTLLWARDIRSGAGERAQFRKLLNALEHFDMSLALRVLAKVPELGRWDDVLHVTSEEAQLAAYEMIRKALIEDQNGLCAKWMPRKGATAVILTKYLGLSPKDYRKLIVGLTKVVETQMCAKQWDKINFSHVPSVASARYQKAFGRNAPEAYAAYIRELQKPIAERDPAVKINASAIFPHEVVRSVSKGNEAVADAQWEALPNYVGSASIFPIVDTSGSMGSLRYSSGSTVQPIEVAVALGLYCSSKNSSSFKDLFMIFDSTPRLVHATGSLSSRLRSMREIIAGSTNLHAAFDQLLSVAVRGEVPQEHMPKTLLILSDMQFNHCIEYDDSAQEMIRRKYTQYGYEVPRIVFWNLRAHTTNSPVSFDDKGVALVSGFSPAILKAVLADNLQDFTPYSVMLQTIMNDRYAY